MRGFLSAFFCVAGLSATAACVSAATLENSHVRVEIGDKGELKSLVSKDTGHDWAGGGGLWRLYFDKRFTPPGTPFAQVREEREISVEASDQTPSVSVQNGRIKILYPSLKCRGKTLAVRLELTVSQDEDGSVRFSSKIDNQEPHSIVREFHYPLVKDCSLPTDAELLVTQLGGMRFKNPVKRIARPGYSPPYMGPDQEFRQFDRPDYVTFKYPSHTVANCFAFITETEGLYFGSHDPTFHSVHADTFPLCCCGSRSIPRLIPIGPGMK